MKKNLMGRALRLKLAVVAAAIVVVAVVIVVLAAKCSDDRTPRVEVDRSIGITPTQVRSIEAIGQWELLTITDEVLVDTTYRHFLATGELVKIYRGTLRLGFDLAHAPKGWLRNVGRDSIAVTLPPIVLLDRNFIDETRTTSFHESGSWTAADREALYQRARREMLSRNMTRQNIASARVIGEQRLTQVLGAMGFSHVGFDAGQEKKQNN